MDMSRGKGLEREPWWLPRGAVQVPPPSLSRRETTRCFAGLAQALSALRSVFTSIPLLPSASPSFAGQKKHRTLETMSNIHALVASGSLLELQSLVSYDKGTVHSRNQFLQTPLHIAAYDGNLSVADLLVLNGAAVNIPDKNKWTPLHAAAHSGHLSLCRYLLDHGADPLLLNEEYNSTVHFLVRSELPKEAAKKEQFWDLLNRFYLAKPELFDQPNDQGERPLHLAALRGQSATVKFLLEHGATIDALSAKGESALFFAARMGHVQTFRLLLESGADLSIYGVHGSVLEVCSQSPFQEEIALAVSQLRGAAQMQSLTLQPLPNGPMGIAPRQRRWRHLKCLAARNLRPKDMSALVDIHFSLHDPSLPATSLPLFRSEVLPSTLNPTWESLSLGGFMPQHTDMASTSTPVPPLPSSAYHLIVRLWCGVSAKVMEFPLNLLHVGYIADIALSFPPDTLLLQLIDGWYTTADVMRALNVTLTRPLTVVQPRLPQKPSKGAKDAVTPEPIRSRELLSHSYNRIMLGIVVALSNRAQEGRVRADALAKNIEQALPAYQHLLLPERQDEALTMRIKRIRACIAEKEAKLKQARQEAALKDRVNRLLLANQALNTKTQIIQTRRQLLAGGTTQLRQLGGSLDRWVTLLVGQIRDFFPIEVQSKTFSIAGLPLPNSDFTGCDEEKVANALSHVCTIVLFLSDLFQVPLRYPIVPLGSRTAIKDDVSVHTTSKFPLYSRGVDRTRFEYGVFLLNKDLEQLMNARGIEVVDLKHTLPNLQTLLLSRSPYVAHMQRNASGQNLRALALADDSRRKLDEQLRDVELDIKSQEQKQQQAEKDLIAFALDMGQLIRAQREMDAARASLTELEKERHRLLGLLGQHAERERQDAIGTNGLRSRSASNSSTSVRLNSSASSDG